MQVPPQKVRLDTKIHMMIPPPRFGIAVDTGLFRQVSGHQHKGYMTTGESLRGLVFVYRMGIGHMRG